MKAGQREPHSTGLTFEQLSLGSVLTSPARTVTESDVTLFAGLSGDYNPLHTDAEFASATQYGQRIAHGMLGLSVATGLAARLGFLDGTALAFLGVDWRFRKPILLGDTVHARIQVSRLKPMPAMGGGIATFAVSVLNQRGETAQKGTWDILVRSSKDSGHEDA